MNAARTNDPDPNPDSETGSSPPARGTVRKVDLMGDRIDSRDLFVGTREITIAHGSENYRLRLTAQNKLILTK